MKVMNSYFLKLTYFVSLILIASSIYINTYWSAFGLSIFPYISVGELVMYGLTPLISISLPILVAMFLGIILFENIFPYAGYQELERQEVETGEKLISNFEKVVRVVGLFTLFGVGPTILVVIFFINIDTFYALLPMIISPFSIILTNRLRSFNIVTNTQIDPKIVFISTFVLLSSFSTAKLDSSKILDNHSFNYVLEDSEIYKFIGKGGDNFFFETLNGSTIIKNTSSSNYLEIFKYSSDLETKQDSVINRLINK